MEIDICGVPMYYGSGIKGSEKGPDKLRKMGIVSILNARDLGDIPVPHHTGDRIHKDSGLLYYEQVLEANRLLAELCYKSAKNGKFVLTMGGDHSIAAGSVSGVSAYYKDMALIWIDAHGDINTPDMSNTKRIHGMPCAFLLGEGDTEFSRLINDKPKITPKNLFVIGGHKLDKGEEIFIKNNDIALFSVDRIRKDGTRRIMDTIKKTIDENNIKNVHISFDIDFLDKSLVPGTGTPAEGGAAFEEAAEILETAAGWGIVRSMDLAELNPVLDINCSTARLCLELLKTFFLNMKAESNN